MPLGTFYASLIVTIASEGALLDAALRESTTFTTVSGSVGLATAKQLARAPHEQVQALARAATNPEVLAVFAADKRTGVKLTVLTNPACTGALLTTVCAWAITTSHLPLEAYSWLFEYRTAPQIIDVLLAEPELRKPLRVNWQEVAKRLLRWSDEQFDADGALRAQLDRLQDIAPGNFRYTMLTLLAKSYSNLAKPLPSPVMVALLRDLPYQLDKGDAMPLLAAHAGQPDTVTALLDAAHAQVFAAFGSLMNSAAQRFTPLEHFLTEPGSAPGYTSPEWIIRAFLEVNKADVVSRTLDLPAARLLVALHEQVPVGGGGSWENPVGPLDRFILPPETVTFLINDAPLPLACAAADRSGLPAHIERVLERIGRDVDRSVSDSDADWQISPTALSGAYTALTQGATAVRAAQIDALFGASLARLSRASVQLLVGPLRAALMAAHARPDLMVRIATSWDELAALLPRVESVPYSVLAKIPDLPRPFVLDLVGRETPVIIREWCARQVAHNGYQPGDIGKLVAGAQHPEQLLAGLLMQISQHDAGPVLAPWAQETILLSKPARVRRSSITSGGFVRMLLSRYGQDVTTWSVLLSLAESWGDTTEELLMTFDQIYPSARLLPL